VTDRGRAEDAVRKLEQQNRLLIDDANDVVMAYDTRGRISFVNRRDALTGLPNRTLLQEQLDAAIHRLNVGRTPLALLLLDLDRFKEVNDALGHGVGDAVLQAVAGRLRDAMRSGDTIARLGGDEFAVLLVDADEGTALQVAQRVRGALAEPIDVSALSLDVGASIGIALAPEHGHYAATLLRARISLCMAPSVPARVYPCLRPPSTETTQSGWD
jgi:diguanylate cyclase (GGDEF)-like protein